MRRQILQNTRNFTASLQNEVSLASRTPFVCANCRRAAQQQRSVKPISSRRSFVSTPSRTQQAAATEAQQPQRESWAPQTHYDFFPGTFPNGPPPNTPFTPDLKQLRKEFIQLQSKTHPDLAASNQKRQAEATSMRVNEAYKALQDPLKRAQYLLYLRGIDVEDESAKLEEKELLMEVMSAREAVEEAESEDELADVRKVNNERIEESVSALEKAFAESDLKRAAEEAVRLRYWMNIEESIHGWEKGRGGGILHH